MKASDRADCHDPVKNQAHHRQHQQVRHHAHQTDHTEMHRRQGHRRHRGTTGDRNGGDDPPLQPSPEGLSLAGQEALHPPRQLRIEQENARHAGNRELKAHARNGQRARQQHHQTRKAQGRGRIILPVHQQGQEQQHLHDDRPGDGGREASHGPEEKQNRNPDDHRQTPPLSRHHTDKGKQNAHMKSRHRHNVADAADGKIPALLPTQIGLVTQQQSLGKGKGVCRENRPDHAGQTLPPPGGPVPKVRLPFHDDLIAPLIAQQQDPAGPVEGGLPAAALVGAHQLGFQLHRIPRRQLLHLIEVKPYFVLPAVQLGDTIGSGAVLRFPGIARHPDGYGHRLSI